MPERVVMFRRFRPSQQELKHGFEWSCSPLLVLSRCFGVSLEFQASRFKQGFNDNLKQWYCWWATTSLGFLLFFLNVECHLALIGIKFIKSDPSEAAIRSRYSSALNWNHYIELTNHIVVIVGVHAVLIKFSLTNWSHLVQTLHCLEKQNFYKEKDYRRFRVSCLVGAIACIAVRTESFIIVIRHITDILL